MMSVASEMRCMAMSKRYMTARVTTIVSGTWSPTMRPVRIPRKATITTKTMAMVWKRLLRTAATARSTWVGW